MKDLKKKSRIFFEKSWPFIFIVFLVAIFFWKVFLLKQIPIPADFVIGTYYPWLDYKWGYEVGVPVKNAITSDVVSVIYPIRSLAIDILKQGEFPLWNPNMFAGYPLFANLQIAILSPTMFFYLLLPKIWGWTAQVIAQPILAAFFSYLFLRHLKLEKFPSLIGGIIYAFSGFSLIWLEWNAHALVAAWIPLILYLGDKYIIEKRVYWGALLSLVVCLQFFSGYPQLVAYTFVAVVMLAWFRRKNVTLKHFLALLLFFLAGLALTSIQLIPALELLFQSQRTTEVLSKDLTYLPWQSLISFFAPDFFGNHATGNYWGPGNYTLNAGYTGIVTFVLATIGLFRYWRRIEIKYLAFLLLIGLIISLPNPISTLVSGFGVFGSAAASNTRILVLVNLSLAFLAAFGLQGLLVDRRASKLRSILLPGVVLLGVLVISLFCQRVFPGLIKTDIRLDVGLRNLVLPIALLSLTALMLIFHRRYYRFSKAKVFVVFFLGAISVLELFRFGWKYTPFSETEYIFPETPVLSFLMEQERPNRILPGNVISANMWIPYELESPAGYDAVYPARWAKYIAVANSGNIDAKPQGRYAILDSYTNRLLDLANGKYLVLLEEDDTTSIYEELTVTGNLEKIFEDRSVNIFLKRQALPRAFFASQWEFLIEDEILERLLDKDFPISEKIILEENFAELDQIIDGKGDVKYVYHGSQRDELEVDTSVAGLLFVADMWYPGWKVFVNGEEKDILRANYTFRAVPLEEGKHKVEFIYDPKSFRIGKWLSLLSATSLLGVIVYEQTKRSKNNS
jgi:hypothetical protein